MLIDSAEVTFKGGHGGAGLVSFGKMSRSGPDGGNGGKGGDLYIRAVSDITLLGQFSAETSFSAGNGEKGGKKKSSGKGGVDLEILLPIGTSLIDKKSGTTLFELTKLNQKELVAKGGIGGKGNWEFRSAKNTTPEFAQSGLPGEKMDLLLSLKLIADYGLIGLPNAGKTSLLNELTNAKAKTGDYAFTTLIANIGVFKSQFLADIPGLIEGASKGRGLGIGFLKHIEKVDTLLHCISADSKNPIKDYGIVRQELSTYNSDLLKKSEILLVTKSDLVDKKVLKAIIRKLSTLNPKILPVSIHDWESLERLKLLIQKGK